MYGLNPFARPRSSYERPVPLVFVNPGENPDYSVCFRHEWVPYILGSLQQLLLQTTWKTDDPTLIAEQQQRAALLIALFAESCPMPVPDGVEFEGSDLDMTLCESLRFQDGKLQAFCCGVWTDIPGQPADGIGGTGQPGDGSPQAPPGGCVKYNAKFGANSTWLLPTVVNTGDTLSFTNAKGASQDGTLTDTWHCPDGGVFYAGACVGSAHFEGTDPAPLIEHMRFVVLINGVYYPADQGVLTVPSGVANAQAAIQVNDSQLYDNAGDLMLTIEFCNNLAASWTQAQNFATTPGGFSPSTDGFDGAESIWTPGTGWQQVTCQSNLLHTAVYDIVYVERDFGSPFTLTHADMLFDSTVGDLDDGGGQKIQAFYGGAWHTLASTPSVDGTGQTVAWDGVQAGITKLLILLYGASKSGTSCPTPGTATLRAANWAGTGDNPF